MLLLDAPWESDSSLFFSWSIESLSSDVDPLKELEVEPTLVDEDGAAEGKVSFKVGGDPDPVLRLWDFPEDDKALVEAAAAVRTKGFLFKTLLLSGL